MKNTQRRRDGRGFRSTTTPTRDRTPALARKIETLGFSGNTVEEMAKMANFIAAANVIGLSDAIVSQTILLRKTYKIKTPDAIIAATAIVQNLTLVTHDIGFQKIDGLISLDANET